MVVVKNPRGHLIMPDQVVPRDEHVVLPAEGDVLIGKREVVLVRLRMNALPLEHIFGEMELNCDKMIASPRPS